MSKNKIIFLILFLVAIAVIFLISSKFYPVALVGLRPVIYSDLDKNYSAAVVYYQKAVLTYNTANADLMKSAEVKNEIRRAGLESAIEDIIISNELVKRLGGV